MRPPGPFIPPEIVIPDGTRVYAIGDIHGHAALLRGLLAAAKEDVCAHPLRPGQDFIFLFLGDYVDRGSDSKGVLDILCGLHEENPRHIFLLGNHDRDFRDVVRFLAGDPTDVSEHEATQITLSGFDTFASYGVPPRYRVDWEIGEMKPLLQRMPSPHRKLLENLTFSARMGKYLFMHDPFDAFLDNGVRMHPADSGSYIYSQRGTSKHPALVNIQKKPIIVHGHVNRADTCPPEHFPHRVGLNYDDSNTQAPILHAAVLEQEKHPRFLSFPKLG